MYDPNHLPLLAWADKQKVQVYAFPAEKRVGRIRSIARVMQQRKSENGRNTYLENSINKYASQLQSAGIEKIEIDIQLHRFKSAIWSEFARLRFIEDSSGL